MMGIKTKQKTPIQRSESSAWLFQEQLHDDLSAPLIGKLAILWTPEL